jgi:hypothetical protein
MISISTHRTWEIFIVAKKWRYIGTALSVRQSVHHKNLTLAITLPFLNILFMELSNYFAYDNMLMMMPNSLGQGHI